MSEFDGGDDRGHYEHLALGRTPEQMKAAEYQSNLASMQRACLRALQEDVGGRQGEITTFEVPFTGNTKGKFELKPGDASGLSVAISAQMNAQTGHAEPELNVDAVNVSADAKGVMLAISTADLEHYRKYRISTGVNTGAGRAG